MEENIISDENLIKFFSKENIEEMAILFSNGSFNDLINKFFYYSPRSDSVSSSHLSERNSNATSASEPLNQNSNVLNNSSNNTPNNNNNPIQTPNTNPNIIINNLNNNPPFPITSPSPFPSISQKNAEFNYNLFEKF